METMYSVTPVDGGRRLLRANEARAVESAIEEATEEAKRRAGGFKEGDEYQCTTDDGSHWVWLRKKARGWEVIEVCKW